MAIEESLISYILEQWQGLLAFPGFFLTPNLPNTAIEGLSKGIRDKFNRKPLEGW